MTAVSLCFFQITLNIPNKPQDLVNLDHLEGKQKDLLVVLHNFISQLPPSFTNGSKLASMNKGDLALVSISPIAKRQFSGVLNVGENGYGAEIFSEVDGKHLFTKSADDLEVIPLSFFIDIPARSQTAILAFQTFGMRTMNSKLRQRIKTLLNDIYQDQYIVKIKAIQIGELFVNEILENGSVQEIEATKYTKPADVASSGKEHIKCVTRYTMTSRAGIFAGVAEIIRKARKSKHKHNVRQEINHLLAIDIPDNVDNLKIGVTFNGKRRKIDVSDYTSYSTRYDISDAIVLGSDMHPTPDSVALEAKQLIDDDIRPLIES